MTARQPITIELNDGAMTLLESLAAQAGQSPDHYGALLLEMAITQEAIRSRAKPPAETLDTATVAQLREIGIL